MSNSVDPDETAHSHLDLCCLQKPIFIACGSERVKLAKSKDPLELAKSEHLV